MCTEHQYTFNKNTQTKRHTSNELERLLQRQRGGKCREQEQKGINEGIKRMNKEEQGLPAWGSD